MRNLRLTRTIGSGSFGTVYQAELSSGQGFRRQVAVKVLHRHQPDSDMFLSRIRDEARLLGLLQDDAILKVLDMVSLAGRDAVVMEYVDGVDLDTLAKGGHAPPPRVLAELGSAVAGALARAHTAAHPTTGQPLNVIHRDVKPANVMVTSSGGVKLLDFGIARARFDARESHTGQLVLGTLNYMAPEYIVTGEVSPAADVYGLALSLWQVAAGTVYGQPKVRQDSHEKRLDERLGSLPADFAPLLPALREMLDWDPERRPAASDIEIRLQDAADEMRGATLRSWSRRTVGQVLEGQAPAEDSAGLLGQTFPLAAGATSAEPEDAPPAPIVGGPPRPIANPAPAAGVPLETGGDKAATTDTPSPSAPKTSGRGTFGGDESREMGQDGGRPAPLPARGSPEAAASSPPPPAALPAQLPVLPPPSSTATPHAPAPDLVTTVIKGVALGATVGLVAVAILLWIWLG